MQFKESALLSCKWRVSILEVSIVEVRSGNRRAPTRMLKDDAPRVRCEWRSAVYEMTTEETYEEMVCKCRMLPFRFPNLGYSLNS